MFERDKGLPPTDIQSVYGQLSESAREKNKRKEAAARLRRLLSPRLRKQTDYHLTEIRDGYKTMANERGFLLVRRLIDRGYLDTTQGVHMEIGRGAPKMSTVDAYVILGPEPEVGNTPASCAIFVNNLNSGDSSLFYIKTGGTEQISETFIKRVEILDPKTGQEFGPDRYSLEGQADLYKSITSLFSNLNIALPMDGFGGNSTFDPAR